MCIVALLVGCAGQPARVPDEPIASPGPVSPIAPTQPETAAPPATGEPPEPFDPELRSELILAAQLGTLTLPAGQGKILVGTSACAAEKSHVLLRVERSGVDARQADLGEVSCNAKKTTRGGVEVTVDGPDGALRYSVRTLALDATTAGIVVDIQLTGESAYHWSSVLVSRPSSLVSGWGSLTGRTSRVGGVEALVIRPNGELWHTYSNPAGPAASYTFELLALDTEGNVSGTPRPASLARVGVFPKKGRTAETATEPLTRKCPALVDRLGRYEVSNAGKGVDIWLGIAASTDEDARAALRDLAKCGAKDATLEKLPADS